jgi:hypothetical protein
MKLTTNSILFIFAILALLMLACIPITLLSIPLITSRQVTPVDSLATVQAMFTPTSPLPSPLPPTVLPPTVVVPPTVVIPTKTPVPTAAPVTYCDWATFVEDVTVPDATTFTAGETFTKIWRVKNRGTCSWSPDYMLAFTGGEQMGGTTAVRLPAYVAPGHSVDVSVTLTAPSASGHYVGYWILRNPAGVLFGSGDKADKPFYVDIYTQEELPHGTVTGNICYPSEFNPPLTIYFERVSNGEVIQFAVPENHMNFSFLLPNDTYYVRAWTPTYGLEGAYVNADRTMKSFVVSGGQTTSGIGICDWDVTPHSRGQ